jgi:hypothetical protein
MKAKRIGSIVVAALGVVMMVYAFSAMGRISEAKGKVSSISSMMSGSSGGRMVGKQLSAEASQYDTKVRVLLIAGIAFTIVGCYGIYRFRKG